MQTVDASHVPSVAAATPAIAVPSAAPDLELNADAILPEPAPAAPKPVRKALHRIVVIGGGSRLGNPDQFSRLFKVHPVGRVSYPSNAFEAGICAASATTIIFDLTGIRFSEMLAMIADAKVYCPRAVLVALLEPGQSVRTFPQCGVHIVDTDPVTPARIVKTIETLLFGAVGCDGEQPLKNSMPESKPGTAPSSNGCGLPNVASPPRP